MRLIHRIEVAHRGGGGGGGPLSHVWHLEGGLKDAVRGV